jgi:superfamily II DNA or RNA helicase
VISPGNNPKGSPMKLLPHQSSLLETFFNPTSKRVILLRGDVGLGKATTLAALAGRVLREQPTARVLFLVPAALRSQFVEMLRDAGTPTLLVDRYRFREMVDSTTGAEFWPSGVVAVLSLDFAKQPDIRDSLAETRWNLVIADEGHLIKGVRAGAFRKVGGSADRVILATATIRDGDPFDAFPAEDVTVVEWRRDQVVDHDGKPLDTGLRPVLHEVPFSLNAAELKLRATVVDLCETLGGATGIQSFMAMRFLRSLESSPAALESALQRLLGGFEAQEELDELLEAPVEEMPEDRLAGRLDRANAEKASGFAARALQEIEAISGDSKLDAFGRLLSDLNEEKMPFRRIYVITQFVGTLYYLAAEIEGRGMACQLLHGGLGAEDRHKSLTLFLDSGVILAATIAVMTEGFALPEVTDLILYDVPGSKIWLQQVLGRFDRFGRRGQLTVHLLTPSNISDGFIATPVDLLRDLLAEQAKVATKALK